VREEADEMMFESRRRICVPKGNEGIMNGRAGNTSERDDASVFIGSDELLE